MGFIKAIRSNLTFLLRIRFHKRGPTDRAPTLYLNATCTAMWSSEQVLCSVMYTLNKTALSYYSQNFVTMKT